MVLQAVIHTFALQDISDTLRYSKLIAESHMWHVDFFLQGFKAESASVRLTFWCLCMLLSCNITGWSWRKRHDTVLWLLFRQPQKVSNVAADIAAHVVSCI